MHSFAGLPRPDNGWRETAGIILIFIADHWLDIIPFLGVAP